jgi:hypothetical protein
MESACMLSRLARKAEHPLFCCTDFLNFGIAKHNPQNGLVLTRRFIISPLKIAQHG